MTRNSFKELEKLHENQFHEDSAMVKKSIDSSIGMFRFIGDIIELFIPKIVGMFVSMSGGESMPAELRDNAERMSDDNTGYPNTKEQ